MSTDTPRLSLGHRLKTWWFDSFSTTPVQPRRASRDDYWLRRADTLVADTRIALRPYNVDTTPIEFVRPALYAAARAVVQRYADAAPIAPVIEPKQSSHTLAQGVVGAIASVHAARRCIVGRAIEGQSMLAGIDVALCIVVEAARRMPPFYAAQVAHDVRDALADVAWRNEAQVKAARAFAWAMEEAHVDDVHSAMGATEGRKRARQQADSNTRSAVSALVYAHTEHVLWQAALQSGGDVPEARSNKLAKARTLHLWSEPWAKLVPSVYFGDQLSKRLD